MFRKHRHQQIPELNTSSTADISFMLLIFFLVTSSMDTDKGLLRQLPPPPQEQLQPLDVQRDLVMQIVLDADNQLTVDGVLSTPEQLTEAIIALASVSPEGHVLSLSTARQTTYESYFRVQDAISQAYATLRNNYALSHYQQPFSRCSQVQRESIMAACPQRLADSGAVDDASVVPGRGKGGLR